MAKEEGIKPADLRPILDEIGVVDVPVAEIPERLRQFVETARARGAEQVRPSNEGADIDAVIGAARDMIGALDVAGARGVLQGKIDEEEDARRARMLPLLKERATVERLAFDHTAAKGTLGEITRLAPDDVGAWIDLGNEWLTTGSLDGAFRGFRSAEEAAERSGGQRELAVSQFWIGTVLEAQGDLLGALTAYRRYLAIAETLAARNAGNTVWQRDLSVSHNKIGDVLVAQGDRPGALAAYRASLAIAQTLAACEAGDTVWQRDLSVSHSKIGDVLVAQDDLPGALAAHRASLAIREALAARDAGNTQWQRDLSVSHEKIGDVLEAQGDLPGTLAAYRASLAIRETLAARDAGNTQWQRDLSVSLGRVADTLLKQGKPDEARPLAERALAQCRAAIARMPDDPRLSRNLPYYEELLRRAGGSP